MTHFANIAREAWSPDVPDWVQRLAEECDNTSQNRAAEAIGRSAALVSNVLRCKYPGDMEAVEDRVRGALMREVVNCPALGEIATHHCRDWRARSRKFAGNNALTVTMYRACNRCSRNRRTET